MKNIKFGDPLTEQEAAIVEKREKERQERLKLYTELDKACENNDNKRASEIVDKLNSESQECEHGRSIWANCVACFEIDLKTIPNFGEENE